MEGVQDDEVLKMRSGPHCPNQRNNLEDLILITVVYSRLAEAYDTPANPGNEVKNSDK